MFVFGEVQDPNSETVNLVEDIVRGQIIELVRLELVSLRQTVSKPAETFASSGYLI